MNIMKKVEKIKINIVAAINKKDYTNALELISLAGNILYNYNQYYSDENLEENIKVISEGILGKSELDNLNEDTVIFYDGFGLDTRGLAQIYLLALCNFKKVIYVTNEKRRNSLPTIKKILKNGNHISYFLPELSKIDKIGELKKIIDQVKPKSIFMYTYPSDVIITTILHHYTNIIDRYQVNLTDHAFWLGNTCIDYCIEFRDYGAYISNKYRNIPKEKIILLPYYPIVNKEFDFEGYPFVIHNQNAKIIFSGGSLYKTFGGEDKYYIIVDYILKSYDDVIFWYAGTGDRSKFDKLIKKYPGRIFLTPERKDLYQVLKHSYFYLSTYPICGGLMFQYAAVAGRLPLTLKYDDGTDGFLINQENLDIEFENLEELKFKIHKIINDEEYLKQEEAQIAKAVITAEQFEKNLISLMKNKKTDFNLMFNKIDTQSLLKEYAQNMTFNIFCYLIAGQRKLCVLKLFPKEFIYGICLKIKKKLTK